MEKSKKRNSSFKKKVNASSRTLIIDKSQVTEQNLTK